MASEFEKHIAMNPDKIEQSGNRPDKGSDWRDGPSSAQRGARERWHSHRNSAPLWRCWFCYRLGVRAVIGAIGALLALGAPARPSLRIW
jgi:hypothetical protein